jgi:hypothetical protein
MASGHLEPDAPLGWQSSGLVFAVTLGSSSRVSLVKQITLLYVHHPPVVKFGNRTARFFHRRAGMLACFLLLLQRGGKWIPLIAIPAVFAGGVASLCLILSGIRGVIKESFRPKRRVGRVARPERVVRWIASNGHRHYSG